MFKTTPNRTPFFDCNSEFKANRHVPNKKQTNEPIRKYRQDFLGTFWPSKIRCIQYFVKHLKN